MATRTRTEGEIKDLLAKALSVSENMHYNHHQVRRYWIEEKGQQFIAFIEVDTTLNGFCEIFRCLLGYHELMAIRAIAKDIREEGCFLPHEDPSLPAELYFQNLHNYSAKIAPLFPTRSNLPMKIGPGSAVPGRHVISIVNLPKSEPLSIPEMAAKCICKDSYFCKEVNNWLYEKRNFDIIWDAVRKNSGHGWMMFGLPFFGAILHRVDVKVSPEKDWEGMMYHEMEVRLRTHRPDPISQFFSKESVLDDHANPLSWVFDTINYDMRNEPVALQQVGVATRFILGETNHGCTSPHHNYGTTRMLREFLTQNDDRSVEVWAQVMSVIYYDKCYICYRDSELALASFDVEL